MTAQENVDAEKVRLSFDEHGFRTLNIRVPGSTANLGPGFDTLALALNLYCNLTFKILDTNDLSIPLITLKGCLTEGLPKDQNNLIYTVLTNFWKNDPELLQRVRITIESNIPLGKGLGSSAAAIMGSVWAAGAFSPEIPLNGALLSQATQLEGHADNVSASLLGGLVICAKSERSEEIITQKLLWPREWSTVVLVPPYVLSTKKARSVLPQSTSYKDAVYNLQRVALLVSAVNNKDEDALQEALHDKLHEPYRLPLIPELGILRKELADLPILGCVLSGAGSSVLTIVNSRHRGQVIDCLKNWSQQQDEPSQVLDLQVDQEGLQVSYE